jgi:hypothetical protein
MKYELTDTEAVLLDGQVSDAAQGLVSAAKARIAAASAYPELTEREAGFIADVVTEAHKELLLAHRSEYVQRCPVCEKDAGYHIRTRTSRNGRRGQPDRSKPKLFRAFEFHESFITIKNRVYLGCCSDCFARVKPYLAEALKDVKAQIPSCITGHKPTYLRSKKMHCKKCEWIGLESEMGRLSSIIGNGWYPGKCPQCGAENQLFTTNIETVVPIEYAVVVNKEGRDY